MPMTATIDALAADFELPDHRGGLFRLHERLVPGGTVLAFYRGHWCPYCRRYLAKLAMHFPKFIERSAQLVGISPEPPETSRALAEELSIPFPLLSDTDGHVIDAYGTRNGFMVGRALLPHPSIFVLDAVGAVCFRSIDRNYKKRTTVRSILQALDGLL